MKIENKDLLTIIKDDDTSITATVGTDKKLKYGEGSSKPINNIKAVRKNGKTYNILTNFQSYIIDIFESAAVITDKRIEITENTIDRKITSLSFSSKFKKVSMKDFLTLINLEKIKNKMFLGNEKNTNKLVTLIDDTYKSFKTMVRKFIGEKRIINLQNRKSDKLTEIQTTIIKKYLEKEKPNMIILYKSGGGGGI